MKVWSPIVIEGYCLFDYLSKKSHIFYSLDDVFKKDKKPLKRQNKDYISPTKRPKWCKKDNKELIPKFKCLSDDSEDKCPFFGYCEFEEYDIKKPRNKVKKKNKLS